MFKKWINFTLNHLQYVYYKAFVTNWYVELYIVDCKVFLSYVAHVIFFTISINWKQSTEETCAVCTVILTSSGLFTALITASSSIAIYNSRCILAPYCNRNYPYRFFLNKPKQITSNDIENDLNLKSEKKWRDTDQHIDC